MKKAIFWFRRDLRLQDNTAWNHAASEVQEILPVYVWDPGSLKHSGVGLRSAALLLECLKGLDAGLKRWGGNLLFIQGDPSVELPRLAQKAGAADIYWNQRPEPLERVLEEKIRKSCGGIGLGTHSSMDDMLVSPGDVLKKDGSPFQVFTPYSKMWRLSTKRTAQPTPPQIKIARMAGKLVPEAKELGIHCDIALPPAGEDSALKALDVFFASKLAQYKSSRDIPFLDATSRLSHHLSFGTISVRVIYHSVLERMRKTKMQKDEMGTFVDELIWRDFYRMILWHFPHVAKGAFKKDMDGISWENDEGRFRKWREGRTGFPIVDAAMRQLNQTGWMHNRLRMIVASFLTKDLLIDWKWGESYFMQQLFDADLASNNGGWQWSAGTGTDAQPYFRIFNPVSQAEKFDPDGKFIQQYVPEAFSKAYPPPMVDHRMQRGKALLLYKRVR